MEIELTRREFLERILPEKRTIQTSFKILKYGVYAFLAYLVFRTLFAFPVSAWILFGAIVLIFLLIRFVAVLYKKQKTKLEEKKSTHVLPALLAVERVVSAAVCMALGILMYRTWLKEPYEAYGIIAVALFLTFKDEYEKRRGQVDSHRAVNCAPSA